MAVRSFDLSHAPDGRTAVLESAPISRQAVRRSRQHWLYVGGLGLLAPFLVAVITIGAVH